MSNIMMKILNVQILKLHDGMENVVNEITFAIVASENEVQSSIVKTCKLDISEMKNFVQFANLTEEKAIEWVNDAVGDEQMTTWNDEANQALKNKIEPKEIIVNPPWI